MPELSPEELLRDELIADLDRRRPLVDLYDAYVQGRHVCSFEAVEDNDVAEMIASVTDNWCELVVLAATERMGIDGLRLASTPRVEDDPLADDFAAWDLFRRNGLDEDLPLLFDTSVTTGESYLLVWPDEEDSDQAAITIEHPSQMIVKYAPGNRRRILAALKKWQEGDDEKVHLWTSAGVYRWSKEKHGSWSVPEDSHTPDPFKRGIVPVFPIVNRPQARPAYPPNVLLNSPHCLPKVGVGLGKSDLANVISTQDEIDQLLRGMLVAAEFQAYQQRWVAGLERPDDEEPEDGEDSPEPPFVAGPGNLWEAEDPNTKFGAFPAADLKMFLDAMNNRVQSMASRSHTPHYYFIGGGSISNVNEGGLKALDTGLVSRVRNKRGPFGGGIRRAVIFALQYEDDRYEGATVEVDWTDPESRSEAQHVDAAIKKIAAGVPLQQIWEDLGYTPEQIARFRGWAMQNAQEAWLLDPVARADAFTAVSTERVTEDADSTVNGTVG